MLGFKPLPPNTGKFARPLCFCSAKKKVNLRKVPRDKFVFPTQCRGHVRRTVARVKQTRADGGKGHGERGRSEGKRAKKQHSDGFRRRGKCDPLVSSTFFLARDAKIFERFLEPRLRRGEANCAENHPTLSVFWAKPQRLNTGESGQRHRMYRPVGFPTPPLFTTLGRKRTLFETGGVVSVREHRGRERLWPWCCPPPWLVPERDGSGQGEAGLAAAAESEHG